MSGLSNLSSPLTPPAGGFNLVRQVSIGPGDSFLREIGPFEKNITQIELFRSGAENVSVPAVEQFKLYQEGCMPRIDLDGSILDYDCGATCGRERDFLSNLASMHNCLAAPIIAENIASADETSQAVARAFRIDQDWEHNISLNGTYQILATRTTLSIVVSCFTEYCRTRNDCLRPLNTCTRDSSCSSRRPCDPEYLISRGRPNGSALAECFEAMCRTSAGTVDPDIGGIGVLVSYLLQVGFAVVGFLSLRILDSWACDVFNFASRVGRWDQFDRERKARLLREQLSPHAHILFLSLQEFHRSQCFLSMALEIAALIAIASNKFRQLDPLQLLTNYLFILAVALNILICVPFTYWYLRRHAWLSWYTFWLSLVSWLLALATYASAKVKFGLAGSFGDLSSAGNAVGQSHDDDLIATYEFCAEMNPLVNCPSSYDISLSPWRTIPDNLILAWPVGLGTFVFLKEAYLLMRPYIDRENFPFTLLRDLTCKIRSTWNKVHYKLMRHKFGKMSLTINYWIFQIFLSAIFASHISSPVVTFSRFLSKGHITTYWGIGQVVPIVVWLPCVLEFFRLEMAGFTFGFIHQLPKEYFAAHGLENK